MYYYRRGTSKHFVFTFLSQFSRVRTLFEHFICHFWTTFHLRSVILSKLIGLFRQRNAYSFFLRARIFSPPLIQLQTLPSVSFSWQAFEAFFLMFFFPRTFLVLSGLLKRTEVRRVLPWISASFFFSMSWQLCFVCHQLKLSGPLKLPLLNRFFNLHERFSRLMFPRRCC